VDKSPSYLALQRAARAYMDAAREAGVRNMDDIRRAMDEAVTEESVAFQTEHVEMTSDEEEGHGQG
jgi:hypothetical protein